MPLKKTKYLQFFGNNRTIFPPKGHQFNIFLTLIFGSIYNYRYLCRVKTNPMNQNNIHKTLSQLRIITKYGMSFICLLMTIHCGLLYMGYDAFVVHLLFWMFVMLIGLKLSQIFGLCWVHKISVIYSMSVIICVVFRTQGIFEQFGIDLTLARGVMFALGIIVCGLNIWKITDNNSSRNC